MLNNKKRLVLLIIFILAAPYLAYATNQSTQSNKIINDAINKIDFRNFDYPPFDSLFFNKSWLYKGNDNNEYYEDTKPLKGFHLKNGVYDTYPEESQLWTQFNLRNIYYSDFNEDDILDALIEIEYFTQTAGGKYQYFAYIFTMKNEMVELLDKFSGIPDESVFDYIFKRGFNHIRFNIKVHENIIFVSDEFGAKGRCCPEYKITFTGQFKENKLNWDYIIEPIKN